MSYSLEQAMGEAAGRVETALSALLPPSGSRDAPLWDAMRYGSLNGGKRLRPFLVLESASLFEVAAAQAMRTAVAVELIHCYSLIHDDLPAMDNSDLRRGRPTVHRAFNDAIAILAGDGLLTYAFEILSEPLTHPDPEVRSALVGALAAAAGPAGMVGGQMLDLIAESTPFDLAETTVLQQKKTGALIGFSAVAGAILGRAAAADREALAAYARDLGLAFQIADDLLDVEGTAATTGKPVGRDAAAGKATFVSLLGPAGARSRANDLAETAAGHLDRFGPRAAMLKAVARFVVERRA